jgi:hypothetical protein
MPRTRLQGSPEFAASSEPERDLHEFLTQLHDSLHEVISREDQVHAHVPFSTREMANQRRTVHEMASAGITDTRFYITRTDLPTTNSWQVPSHILSILTHTAQFSRRDDEDAPGHLSWFVRITGAPADDIYLDMFPFSLVGRAVT